MIGFLLHVLFLKSTGKYSVPHMLEGGDGTQIITMISTCDIGQFDVDLSLCSAVVVSRCVDWSCT